MNARVAFSVPLADIFHYPHAMIVHSAMHSIELRKEDMTCHYAIGVID